MTNKTILSTVIFTFFFLFPSISYAGFGVSPSAINIKGVKPNQIIERNFVLSRNNPIFKEKANVRIQGDLLNHISFPEEVILQKGEQRVSFPIKIDTAGLNPNQVYDSEIIFIYEKPTETKSSTASTFPGVKTLISLETTSESILNYEFKNVILNPIDESEKVSLSYFILNSGNQDLIIDKILIKIKDILNSQKEIDFIAVSEKNLIRAFSEKDTILQTNLNLDPGRYSASISFYQNNEVIHNVEGKIFQVSADESLFNVEFKSILIGVAAVLISSGLYFILISTKKNYV